MKKPRIGITMGDPNGVGPEIILKALSQTAAQGLCTPTVFGGTDVLESAKELTKLDLALDIKDPDNFHADDLRPGKVDKKAGQASLSYIREAVKAAVAGEIDAVVTAPISKESTHLAGSGFPGHTEMLKELTGSENAVMMFEGGAFRVVLVTIHTALSEVPELITKDSVLTTIKITDKALREMFDIPEPRLAVCGLNPHAGESGAFGDEEITDIKPAVTEAVGEGINAEGPLPADTLFYYANQGKWDAVIAMYHDQGLIPFKMLSFNEGVNVTIGLPIIRTSPDHGTAFDIAWSGTADPSSMLAAINVAVRLSSNRNT
jgi:4-hydroxythreonine-4-phosphate dehydrogenase